MRVRAERHEGRHSRPGAHQAAAAGSTGGNRVGMQARAACSHNPCAFCNTSRVRQWTPTEAQSPSAPPPGAAHGFQAPGRRRLTSRAGSGQSPGVKVWCRWPAAAQRPSCPAAGRQRGGFSSRRQSRAGIKAAAGECAPSVRLPLGRTRLPAPTCRMLLLWLSVSPSPFCVCSAWSSPFAAAPAAAAVAFLPPRSFDLALPPTLARGAELPSTMSPTSACAACMLTSSARRSSIRLDSAFSFSSSGALGWSAAFIIFLAGEALSTMIDGRAIVSMPSAPRAASATCRSRRGMHGASDLATYTHTALQGRKWCLQALRDIPIN